MTRKLEAAALLSLPALLLCATVHAATPKTALVMAWNIDAISTFDPAQIGEVVTGELMDNTCDTLARFDPKDESKVLPSFAQSWDVAPDRMQITFHLRHGAKFPSGNIATAHDVEQSMRRVVKLGFGNAAALTEYGFTKGNVDERIVATDDDTLVLKLDKPYPTSVILQAIAAYRVSAVLDMKTVMAHEQNGDMGNKYLATNTACVGPYRLVTWHAGESVVLQANDDYWGPKPQLKRILIRHVAEPGTQRLLLEKGDVDVARDLGSDDLAAMEKSKDISIDKVLKPQLVLWTFNTADPIFANEKVRLAMRYLVDYDGLAKTVMAYTGVPRASFAQLGATGALDAKAGEPFHLDLAKAKQLLTEAGYPNGFKASLLLGTLSYSSPLGESIQQNAAKVGVTLSLERMANTQLFSRTRGREYQTAIQPWQTSIPDAHGNASRLVQNPDNRAEAKLTQYPVWRTSWQDKGMNAEVQAALLEGDPEKRNAMYARLQEEWMQKGPIAVMFQTYNVAGVRKEVHDWTWNGFRVYYDKASK
ncbi:MULTISPECIES: ABC transporter substrate-binding protein [unclassified Achromobacter]|uniref:ABC transporter substrate-binding protein n=1 Tax=unclassified Achromobacter TaxID=2626865 RepID=UPI000B518784|nr:MULTISPECIES: ABC transporter substrate-binding protein [unclassified Achromobacter]OWT77055.1 peptide ABC transporter substrate-binding protein [Achromobacter sp. HZ28]OWT77936.1 peptide ABC transporter substrate-binding protein [Achromobacter sp. HZ34]